MILIEGSLVQEYPVQGWTINLARGLMLVKLWMIKQNKDSQPDISFQVLKNRSNFNNLATHNSKIDLIDRVNQQKNDQGGRVNL